MTGRMPKGSNCCEEFVGFGTMVPCWCYSVPAFQDGNHRNQPNIRDERQVCGVTL
ncbi:hypothetical protein DPMN_012090 [Dreissena polymorpha]|uniref:Uncharacterized protein n=1 Tax=Dreissena polymorpha TaxID=45954 RepID=A0A9D4I3I0_DREPO|nr:hypothetical protein DPMN_049083 [Dreissena polymorpha]KAH3812697.1 hypothetical protein DPMN_141135 [Dreissena polymorpha]KAH3887873.1 hypothetical protein DPMN_011895 [Dreissena polymorpha]KAH3888068.1 hypothetical protein DPMN_012090 [Dreissena polymorpha]